jgi:glutathione S-transferase
MRLFGSTDSGHSYKVRSFLLLNGIAHDYQWVDLALAPAQRHPDFAAASRYGEVPALVDAGQALCQSNAILIHLARRHDALRGAPGEWQRVLEWLSWEANRIGFSVPNLRYNLLWSAPAPAVLDYLSARALTDLATLDQALAESAFLLASGPSIADISCSAYLFWLPQIGVAEDDYPHVARWLARLRALPGWVHPDQAMRADFSPSARRITAQDGVQCPPGQLTRSTHA